MRGTADAARLDVLNPLRLLLPLSVLRLQWLLRLLRPIRRRGALSPFRDRRLSWRHKPRSRRACVYRAMCDINCIIFKIVNLLSDEPRLYHWAGGS